MVVPHKGHWSGTQGGGKRLLVVTFKENRVRHRTRAVRSAARRLSACSTILAWLSPDEKPARQGRAGAVHHHPICGISRRVAHTAIPAILSGWFDAPFFRANTAVRFARVRFGSPAGSGFQPAGGWSDGLTAASARSRREAYSRSSALRMSTLPRMPALKPTSWWIPSACSLGFTASAPAPARLARPDTVAGTLLATPTWVLFAVALARCARARGWRWHCVARWCNRQRKNRDIHLHARLDGRGIPGWCWKNCPTERDQSWRPHPPGGWPARFCPPRSAASSARRWAAIKWRWFPVRDPARCPGVSSSGLSCLAKSCFSWASDTGLVARQLPQAAHGHGQLVARTSIDGSLAPDPRRARAIVHVRWYGANACPALHFGGFGRCSMDCTVTWPDHVCAAATARPEMRRTDRRRRPCRFACLGALPLLRSGTGAARAEVGNLPPYSAPTGALAPWGANAEAVSAA